MLQVCAKSVLSDDAILDHLMEHWNDFAWEMTLLRYDENTKHGLEAILDCTGTFWNVWGIYQSIEGLSCGLIQFLQKTATLSSQGTAALKWTPAPSRSALHTICKTHRRFW